MNSWCSPSKGTDAKPSCYWQCVLFLSYFLAISMDGVVGQACVLAGLIWVLVERRRVRSGYKRLSLFHLFVAVGDLGDFCLQFFIFFTRQLGHELFICFSSLTPTS